MGLLAQAKKTARNVIRRWFWFPGNFPAHKMTPLARPDSYKLASLQYQPLHVQTFWDILQVAKNQTQNSIR